MTTIYVGNLPFTATEDEVRSLFERYGKVDSVKLINDRETGRPRGFAFVDMAAGEAQNAIQQTNGFQMGGRPLRVNEAQERAPRSKPAWRWWRRWRRRAPLVEAAADRAPLVTADAGSHAEPEEPAQAGSGALTTFL